MDLIEVLQQKTASSSEDAMTFQELKEQLGWHDGKIYEALRARVRAGEIEVVFVQRPNMIGTIRRTPAYRTVKDNGN
jgi:hypothetical protein